MAAPAILVTGGATRIGEGIVRAFAAAGWHVVIHYRSSGDAANRLAGELASAETVACDLADNAAIDTMMEGLAKRLPDWRCVVNSAAVFRYDDPRDLDPQIYRQAMQVNAFAPVRIAQRYFALGQSTGLRCVINMTDMKVANPNPDFASYTMAKNALDAAVPMLAIDRRSHGAAGDRVYGIAPGAILPSHDQSPGETEVSHRLNLLRRKTEAGEIADAALFLAGGALASGSTLFVDSGQHLLSQDRDVIWLARDNSSD